MTVSLGFQLISPTHKLFHAGRSIRDRCKYIGTLTHRRGYEFFVETTGSFVHSRNLDGSPASRSPMPGINAGLGRIRTFNLETRSNFVHLSTREWWLEEVRSPSGKIG